MAEITFISRRRCEKKRGGKDGRDTTLFVSVTVEEGVKGLYRGEEQYNNGDE